MGIWPGYVTVLRQAADASLQEWQIYNGDAGGFLQISGFQVFGRALA